jgi:hypothetical protein
MTSTIKVTLEASSDGTLHLPLQPELRHGKLNVVATVETAESNSLASTDTVLKGFGCLKGKIWIAPDFDQALEDFKDYME